MKKILLCLIILLTITTKATAMSYTQASKQNKPILILFVMTGCSACKNFEPLLDGIRPKYAKKYNFVKENISYSMSDIAIKLRVNMAPSLFVVEPKKNKAREVDYGCMWDRYCLDGALKSYK